MTKNKPEKIKIYGDEALEPMTKAGNLAASVLDFITPYVKAGISTGNWIK